MFCAQVSRTYKGFQIQTTTFAASLCTLTFSLGLQTKTIPNKFRPGIHFAFSQPARERWNSEPEGDGMVESHKTRSMMLVSPFCFCVISLFSLGLHHTINRHRSVSRSWKMLSQWPRMPSSFISAHSVLLFLLSPLRSPILSMKSAKILMDDVALLCHFF